MPFIIDENIEEKDYDPLFVIQWEAFIDEPVFVEIYPGGLEPSARPRNVAEFKAFLEWTDPQMAAAKVVDDVTGQICAFATMRIYDENPFPDAPDSDVQFSHIQGKRREWLEWIFNTKNDRRRAFKELQVSGPYCYLIALGTLPTRQREGAATLLVKWAVDIIDKKGSRAMLEASREAVQYKLYEKHGFRAIDDYTYADEERFPHLGGMSAVTMVRDARGQ